MISFARQNFWICSHLFISTFIYFALGDWSKKILLHLMSENIFPGVRKCQRMIPWSKKWQFTPAFLSGEYHGWRSLESYSPWSHKEVDMSEWLSMHAHFLYGSHSKASACDAGDLGSIPGSGRSTPALLPGKSRGRWSLVGCSPWGC